jgi:hypothetical protein
MVSFVPDRVEDFVARLRCLRSSIQDANALILLIEVVASIAMTIQYDLY